MAAKIANVLRCSVLCNECRSTIVHSSALPKEQANVSTLKDRQILDHFRNKNTGDADELPGSLSRN